MVFLHHTGFKMGSRGQKKVLGVYLENGCRSGGKRVEPGKQRGAEPPWPALWSEGVTLVHVDFKVPVRHPRGDGLCLFVGTKSHCASPVGQVGLELTKLYLSLLGQKACSPRPVLPWRHTEVKHMLEG